MSGFVYFIACPETFRVKIGYTAGNVYKRLKALQTGSPSQLLLMAAQPGTQEDKRRLHEKYAEHRLHGEWFTMCEELFEHVSMIVWLSAVDAQVKGQPLPQWVRIGLESMNEDHPLPPHMAEMIQ